MSEPRTTVVNVKTDEYDVYIGRSNRRYKLPLSIWANPFKIGPDGTREEVIAKYREYVLAEPRLMAHLPELRGKRLGCWCKERDRDVPCHGDVLAELADMEAPE